jgi:LytS/YehU family sensor histidine kinase
MALGYRRIARGRVAWAIGGALGLGALWGLAGLGYARAIGVELDAPAELAYFPRRVLIDAVMLLGWSALYFAIRHAGALRDAHARALAAELAAERARLAALRHQLQPHFLFNALNSIRALIDEDPARARAMITGVADLLRHALAEPGDARVALADELDAVDTYLAVEAIRFEDQLAVRIDVAPDVRGLAVPAFAVMPLVENAIKHGFVPGAPLAIEIRAARDGDQLRLEVANTGRWRAAPGGTGLANLRARLAADGAGLAIAEADGWVRAVITVPA